MAKKKTFDEYKAYYQTMARGYDKAEQIESTDSVTMKIKKRYIQVTSQKTVAEWAMENITDFAPNPTAAYRRVNDLLCESCGDDDIDFTCNTVMGYAYTAMSRKW